MLCHSQHTAAADRFEGCHFLILYACAHVYSVLNTFTMCLYVIFPCVLCLNCICMQPCSMLGDIDEPLFVLVPRPNSMIIDLGTRLVHKCNRELVDHARTAGTVSSRSSGQGLSTPHR